MLSQYGIRTILQENLSGIHGRVHIPTPPLALRLHACFYLVQTIFHATMQCSNRGLLQPLRAWASSAWINVQLMSTPSRVMRLNWHEGTLLPQKQRRYQLDHCLVSTNIDVC